MAPIMNESLFWYDLEATGTDPCRDRIIQFAGVRTDLRLRQIEEPVNHYGRCPVDILPSPSASLVTRWTPPRTPAEALRETDLLEIIHARFSVPGTCIVGYNSLLFDDRFVRYGLFRNFFDPHAWASSNGNSRWDMSDVVRTYAAIFPGSLKWRYRYHRKQGVRWPSFRLQDLTAANKIPHHRAHDALSDTMATLSLAKLMRTARPAMFGYLFAHRSAAAVRRLLGTPLSNAVLLVSRLFSFSVQRMRPVALLAWHPHEPDRAIVVDLLSSPEWLTRPNVALKILASTNQDVHHMVAGNPLPLRQICIRDCPALLPLGILDARSSNAVVDVREVTSNLEYYRANTRMIDRLMQRYGDSCLQETDSPGDEDVDASLYTAGPLTRGDCREMEMRFRHRARNYPERLTDAERTRWHRNILARMRASRGESAGCSPAEENLREIERLLAKANGKDRVLLQELKTHTRQLLERVGQCAPTRG